MPLRFLRSESVPHAAEIAVIVVLEALAAVVSAVVDLSVAEIGLAEAKVHAGPGTDRGA